MLLYKKLLLMTFGTTLIYVLLFISLISIQDTYILYRKETMYRYKCYSDPYRVTAPTDYRTSNGPSTAARLVLFI